MINNNLADRIFFKLAKMDTQIKDISYSLYLKEITISDVKVELMSVKNRIEELITEVEKAERV